MAHIFDAVTGEPVVILTVKCCYDFVYWFFTELIFPEKSFSFRVVATTKNGVRTWIVMEDNFGENASVGDVLQIQERIFARFCKQYLIV